MTALAFNLSITPPPHPLTSTLPIPLPSTILPPPSNPVPSKLNKVSIEFMSEIWTGCFQRVENCAMKKRRNTLKIGYRWREVHCTLCKSRAQYSRRSEPDTQFVDVLLLVLFFLVAFTQPVTMIVNYCYTSQPMKCSSAVWLSL